MTLISPCAIGLWACALCTLSLAPPAHACGGPEPCRVSGGAYLIVLPEGATKERPVGAILFFHGWRNTAANMVADGKLVAQATDRALAFIAPQGAGDTWSYPGSPSRRRNEFAFVEAVLDDVAARFPIDTDRVMASGFSMGGSMVWNLACTLGDRFAAFAPIAGGFWEPIPDACAAPVPRMIHIHGTADTTVPLEGRPIGSSWRQGAIDTGFDVWTNGAPACEGAAPRRFGADRRLTCTRVTPCGAPAIDLCLHDGGHWFDADWVGAAWDRLMRERR